jgi:phosphotransferase system  glucose/maltose/N-acetylglucosamine-specific IIC component
MTILGDFMREAGWPIYPILGFGLAALVMAMSHARRPRESTAQLIRGLGLVTLLIGVLGTILGLQHSIHFIDPLPPDQRWIVFTGLREALNCTVGSLLLLFPTLLLYTAGAVRGRQLVEAEQDRG